MRGLRFQFQRYSASKSASVNDVYFLNPDGSKRAEFSAGSPVLSTPAIMKAGTVVVGSAGGNVYFFLNPNGTEKARYQTGGAVNTTPAILKDGTVVVGSSYAGGVAIFLNPDGTKRASLWAGRSHSVVLPNDTVWVRNSGKGGGTIYKLTDKKERVDSIVVQVKCPADSVGGGSQAPSTGAQ